jgi:hypothetical protein
MNQAAQESARGQDHRAGSENPAIHECDASGSAVPHQDIIHLGFDDAEIGRIPDSPLHRRRIKLAVGLTAGTANRWAFAAIENAELDAALVGGPAHEAVKGIDFPDQVTFAQTTNGGIAGHGADGGESVGDQPGFGAHTRGCSRGFATGMAAANDDNIEFAVHVTF